ncbi:DUF427 domain-containing protein [Pseudonocardia abyssalis]|uniref:DUF427 domain-containing protein n=1 Tax=Pseudonocardia abyssalis TaxID=2792008 RepID=A0ABS6UUK0_9PSEU|nr:DUF427 domain-containing protein [Pseudonocardia abyssalis]MBW0117736.1 DUF427 domain-containing protein [Pseudonocardia abyssalis]MBW0135933.1 DUF427 domain-containing protein [Pseudonocardia abyssalis]
MATRLADHFSTVLDTLRIEPTPVRLRGLAAGAPAVDTTAALLVWEPGRVVPQYAVPESDLLADLLPADPDAGPRYGPGPQPLGPDGVAVLTPATGFGVHSADGEPLTLRIGGSERIGAAFRPTDPDLAGYVIVDFAALDWLEEEEPVVSHPRDPFHRVDARRSGRRVRIELDGHVLAESDRPTLVTETGLPVRWYLPPADVDTTRLRPSDTVTACAYKGVASYLSVTLPGRSADDLAWTYPRPLRDAEALTDLVSFFTEHVDVTVDEVRTVRPVSPWS